MFRKGRVGFERTSVRPGLQAWLLAVVLAGGFGWPGIAAGQSPPLGPSQTYPFTSPPGQGGAYVPPPVSNQGVPGQGGAYAPPPAFNQGVPGQGGIYVPPPVSNQGVPGQGGTYVPPPAFNQGVPVQSNQVVPAQPGVPAGPGTWLPGEYPAPVAPQSSSADLAPDRRRSTDIPRFDDLAATPGFPTVKLTGFFQADAGWFAQDAASRAAVGDIEDVRGFRRARLAAVGDVADTASYMIEMDFAFLGRPSFMDVWADIHQVPLLGNVRVGQWRMPFGMSEMTSVRELTFLERPTMFGLAPFRQIGIGFHDTNAAKTVTWSAAGFGYPTDPFGDAFGDGGYGAAARVTALPLYVGDGCQLLHVGFDWAYLSPSNGALTFRNQPEFGGPFGGQLGNLASVPFFVDTGAIPAVDANLLNAELGYGLGSWYVQSELRYALVNLAGAGTAAFPGVYVHTGYFLTGERRPYDRTNGVFGRVKPLAPHGKGGLGALEVAARYSYLNLNDAGIRGGELSDVTLGVNWYLNQYLKFQFNYIHAMLCRNGFDSDTDIFAVRCQLDF